MFGITGSSGSGKSYISDIFRKNGFFMIDADKIAHRIIMPDTEAYFELRNYFGNGILLENGAINRRKLGSIVFSDKESLEFLNSVTHPKIREEIYRMAEGKGDRVGVDGSLLIECMIVCHPIIAVVADRNIQIERIVKRDGISRELAGKRLDMQKSNDFYRRSCNFTIENNGGDIEEAVKKIVDRL